MVESTGDDQLDQLRLLVRSQGLDRLLPPFDGTAFYLLTCRINHSCQPNVIVKYVHCSSGEGVLRAGDVLPGQ